MECYIVVYEDNYCDTNIDKVFINQEDAEQYCKLINAEQGWIHSVYEADFIGASTTFVKEESNEDS